MDRGCDALIVAWPPLVFSSIGCMGWNDRFVFARRYTRASNLKNLRRPSPVQALQIGPKQKAL